jgi:ComF family protein
VPTDRDRRPILAAPRRPLSLVPPLLRAPFSSLRARHVPFRAALSVLHTRFPAFDAPVSALPRQVADGVLTVLLAPRCVACGASLESPLDGPVCASCWRGIAPITPPICRTCGDALPTWRERDRAGGCCARCRRQPPGLACARAAGAYDGVLRRLIHCLKYEGRRALAVRLGAMMRERGADVLEGADLVVPVPLHWRRQHARGFNHADDLARALGLPVARALRRVRATSPQFGLSAGRRARNVRGAFAPPRRGWRGRRRHDGRLQGACVVLVDDVSTTGATLRACAEVLTAGGAREVRALTAARAMPRRR